MKLTNPRGRGKSMQHFELEFDFSGKTIKEQLDAIWNKREIFSAFNIVKWHILDNKVVAYSLGRKVEFKKKG